MFKIAKALIVEDDDYQFEIYQEALEDYELIRAKSGSEALDFLKTHAPDLIILDHVLAEGELGLDFLPTYKDLMPHVPVIVISGALEAHQQMQALTGPRRAHYCIMKPLDLDELQSTVETALKECGEAEIIRQFESLERSRRVDAQDLFSRSTDRLSRQTQLLQKIQTQSEKPNISALAREFKVARKTILRDLSELIRRGQLDSSIMKGRD